MTGATRFTSETGETVAVFLQSTGEITIPDFFVYAKGGVVVARLDAKFDLRSIAPDSHAFVANLLVSRKMHLSGLTDEHLARDRRRSERYAARKAEYEAFPWYKRLFTKRPWSHDPENDDALEGLHDVAEVYADRAEADLVASNFPSAKFHIDRGLKVEPGNERLRQLKQDTSRLRRFPEKVVSSIKSIFD